MACGAARPRRRPHATLPPRSTAPSWWWSSDVARFRRSMTTATRKTGCSAQGRGLAAASPLETARLGPQANLRVARLGAVAWHDLGAVTSTDSPTTPSRKPLARSNRPWGRRAGSRDAAGPEVAKCVHTVIRLDGRCRAVQRRTIMARSSASERRLRMSGRLRDCRASDRRAQRPSLQAWVRSDHGRRVRPHPLRLGRGRLPMGAIRQVWTSGSRSWPCRVVGSPWRPARCAPGSRRVLSGLSWRRRGDERPEEHLVGGESGTRDLRRHATGRKGNGIEGRTA